MVSGVFAGWTVGRRCAAAARNSASCTAWVRRRPGLHRHHDGFRAWPAGPRPSRGVSRCSAAVRSAPAAWTQAPPRSVQPATALHGFRARTTTGSVSGHQRAHSPRPPQRQQDPPGRVARRSRYTRAQGMRSDSVAAPSFSPSARCGAVPDQVGVQEPAGSSPAQRCPPAADRHSSHEPPIPRPR